MPDLPLSTLLAFAFVTTLLIVSPGPNGVLVARTVPTSGKSAGFANIAGFFTAFYIHGTLAVFGWSALLVKSAEFFLIFKLVGAAYLAWIGLKALRDAWKGAIAKLDVPPSKRKRTLVSAYFEGLLTNALNPKVSMFYLAAFPQFMTPGSASVANAYTLVFVHSMLNVIWFTLMILFLAQLKAVSGSGKIQRWIKGVTGVAFLSFSAKLATYRP